MQAANNTREFLEAVAGNLLRPTIEGLVLERGRAFEAKRAPVAMGSLSDCYRNAGTLALDDENYRYVEGYACSEALPIPLPHGWVVDVRDGKAVDPTWPDGYDYFGVEFDTDWLRRAILDQRTWGVMERFAREEFEHAGC